MSAARAWKGGGRQFSESRLPARMLGEVDALATGGLADPPVIVVVCALKLLAMPALAFLLAKLLPAGFTLGGPSL